MVSLATSALERDIIHAERTFFFLVDGPRGELWLHSDKVRPRQNGVPWSWGGHGVLGSGEGVCRGCAACGAVAAFEGGGVVRWGAKGSGVVRGGG